MVGKLYVYFARIRLIGQSTYLAGSRRESPSLERSLLNSPFVPNSSLENITPHFIKSC